MNEKTRTYLVPVGDDEATRVALRYAARRARSSAGRVALLYVVEPEEIETWSGVERAMDDEAFSQAREGMRQYEKMAEDLSGTQPETYYGKGKPASAVMELIERERHIAVLVLAAQNKDGARGQLLQDLTSEKGLKKLAVPLIIVPPVCREDGEAGE